MMRFVQWWWPVLIVAIAAAYVTWKKPYNQYPSIRADGQGYHVWTYAIIRGDFRYTFYEGNPDHVYIYGPFSTENNYVNKYPIGVALVRLPVMVFVVDHNWKTPPFSKGEHLACLIVSAVVLCITVALMLSACYRMGLPMFMSQAVVIFITGGTGLFHYGTNDASFSHVYSAMFVALLVWLAARAVPAGRPMGLIGVAFAVAMLILTRTTNVFPIGTWMVAAAVWIWWIGGERRLWLRPIFGTALGMAIGVGATALINHTMIGRWTLNSYIAEKFNWDTPNIDKVLIDKEMGLFPVYPVIGIALLAGLLCRRTAAATVWMIVLVLAFAVLYGYWASWHLGVGFGHRGYVEIVPMFVPIFAVAVAQLPPRLSGAFLGAGLSATVYTIHLMCKFWA